MHSQLSKGNFGSNWRILTAISSSCSNIIEKDSAISIAQFESFFDWEFFFDWLSLGLVLLSIAVFCNIVRTDLFSSQVWAQQSQCCSASEWHLFHLQQTVPSSSLGLSAFVCRKWWKSQLSFVSERGVFSTVLHCREVLEIPPASNVL